jgi:hypothetical protein
VSIVDEGVNLMVVQTVVVAVMLVAMVGGCLLLGRVLRRRRWLRAGLLAPAVLLAGYLFAASLTGLVVAASAVGNPTSSDGVVPDGTGC